VAAGVGCPWRDLWLLASPQRQEPSGIVEQDFLTTVPAGNKRAEARIGFADIEKVVPVSNVDRRDLASNLKDIKTRHPASTPLLNSSDSLFLIPNDAIESLHQPQPSDAPIGS